jgi:outer membrane protein OmpU
LALQSGALQLKYGAFPLRIPLRRAYLEERGKNMKKLLLATSILAGTAGLAAAEITLSGDARMGFLNDYVFDAAGDDDTGFTSRARVTFTFSGETDGGLSFGASFRADNSSNAASGRAGSVFLSGSFGKISMGDVDGAANAAVGHVDGVGLTGLGDAHEIRFIANGGLDDDDVTDLGSLTAADPLTNDPSVLYEYTTGNIGLFVSVTDPGYDVDFDPTVVVDAFDGIAWAIGANYTTEGYKFSIGYEDLDVDDQDTADNLSITHLVLGADATFGAFTAKVRWGQADVDVNGVNALDYDQWALSGTYSMDALSVTGFYSDKQFSDAATGANGLEVTALGLGASYDLGGGASIVGGIVDAEETAGVGPSVSDTAFDFGVSFSF